MSRLTLAEVDEIRDTPGRSVLLFLTDRCPVGCAHCSVDSRPDSPTIRDFALFESILDGLCGRPTLSTVGISGGEPFVERRGLTLAVERLAAAGKQLVLYTSGVWAIGAIPAWIPPVVRRASCVFLSTDAFHASQVDDERWVRAARAIVAEDVWLIVQVIKVPEMVAAAERLLEKAFGEVWHEHAELSLTPPLPYGRGAGVFQRTTRWPGESFGTCGALAAPVVRYDGVLTACCNEQVIVGLGPERLRQRVGSAAEMEAALERLHDDPVLGVIGRVGAGVLTYHPAYADLAQRRVGSICELCWRIQERSGLLGDAPDPVIGALAGVAARAMV